MASLRWLMKARRWPSGERVRELAEPRSKTSWCAEMGAVVLAIQIWPSWTKSRWWPSWVKSGARPSPMTMGWASGGERLEDDFDGGGALEVRGVGGLAVGSGLGAVGVGDGGGVGRPG